jgi:hypothetical protein
LKEHVRLKRSCANPSLPDGVFSRTFDTNHPICKFQAEGIE